MKPSIDFKNTQNNKYVKITALYHEKNIKHKMIFINNNYKIIE